MVDYISCKHGTGHWADQKPDCDKCRIEKLQVEIKYLQKMLTSRELAEDAARRVPRHRPCFTGGSANDGLKEAADIIQRVYSKAAEAAGGNDGQYDHRRLDQPGTSGSFDGLRPHLADGTR